MEQNNEFTRITLLQNDKISSYSVKDFLEHMNYKLASAEPIWFDSNFYKKPKMFIGNADGKPVFVGPYMAGDGISIVNDTSSKRVGEIRMKYPIPVLSGNSGKVLAVSVDETHIEWADLNIEHGTTEYWNSRIGYVPEAGKIIIYDDYKTETIEGKTVMYPGIKVGNGNAYVQDLMFADSYYNDLFERHINDASIHVTPQDKQRWNRKLNVDDIQGVENETLIFNRN